MAKIRFFSVGSKRLTEKYLYVVWQMPVTFPLVLSLIQCSIMSVSVITTSPLAGSAI